MDSALMLAALALMDSNLSVKYGLSLPGDGVRLGQSHHIGLAIESPAYGVLTKTELHLVPGFSAGIYAGVGGKLDVVPKWAAKGFVSAGVARGNIEPMLDVTLSRVYWRDADTMGVSYKLLRTGSALMLEYTYSLSR